MFIKWISGFGMSWDIRNGSASGKSSHGEKDEGLQFL